MRKARQFSEMAVSYNEKASTLKKSRLCVGMSMDEVNSLVPFVTPFHLDAGTDVYQEGDTEAFLCLIVAGKVNVYKNYDTVSQKTLAQLGVGETVGEMAVIDERPRSASAIATEESTLYSLTRRNMMEFSKVQPATWGKLIYNIAVMLCNRIRQANVIISEGGVFTLSDEADKDITAIA